MIRILCAHLATRRLVADVHIYPTGSVAKLKALVLGKLAERDPTGQEHRVERWLFDAKAEGSEPSLAEIAEADDAKAVGALGLNNYSILYLDAPALPDKESSLGPVKCFWDALIDSSDAGAAEITAIVTRLNCGLEAKMTSEDGLGVDDDATEEDEYARSYVGATPLILAALLDRTDVAISLIAAGANVNAASANKHTALHIACWAGSAPLVELLLSAGAELECRDADGKTPLLHVAFEGHVGILKTLLAAGANADAADNDDQTPLHWASCWGLTSVEALLAAGANTFV